MSKKNQKPIDYDCHLKYLCDKCGQEHWLSFRETSTKGFKIVCYCGNIFCVKTTIGLKIKYKTVSEKKINKEKIITPIVEEIPVDLLKQTVTILTSYGFTSSEASELVKKSYATNPIKDVAHLVKQSLESIRS